MPFFHFSQNNSGGSFDQDIAAGITHHVVIEANSSQHANDRAEEIGLYFDGCEKGMDCDCCGDRWSPAWGPGDAEPMIYGSPALDYEDMWMSDPVAIHYLDSRMVIAGKRRSA